MHDSPFLGPLERIASREFIFISSGLAAAASTAPASAASAASPAAPAVPSHPATDAPGFAAAAAAAEGAVQSGRQLMVRCNLVRCAVCFAVQLHSIGCTHI